MSFWYNKLLNMRIIFVAFCNFAMYDYDSHLCEGDHLGKSRVWGCRLFTVPLLFKQARQNITFLRQVWLDVCGYCHLKKAQSYHRITRGHQEQPLFTFALYSRSPDQTWCVICIVRRKKQERFWLTGSKKKPRNSFISIIRLVQKRSTFGSNRTKRRVYEFRYCWNDIGFLHICVSWGPAQSLWLL